MRPCFLRIKTVVTKLGEVSKLKSTDFIEVLSIFHDSSNMLPQANIEVAEKESRSFILPAVFTCHEIIQERMFAIQMVRCEALPEVHNPVKRKQSTTTETQRTS